MRLTNRPAGWDNLLLRRFGWQVTAGERARADSLGLGALAGRDAALKQAVPERANDWAQLRPERGLAENTAFMVVPRAQSASEPGLQQFPAPPPRCRRLALSRHRPARADCTLDRAYRSRTGLGGLCGGRGRGSGRLAGARGRDRRSPVLAGTTPPEHSLVPRRAGIGQRSEPQQHGYQPAGSAPYSRTSSR